MCIRDRLGVLLYFVARDLLGSLTETWLLWYGLMFMGMVMFRPEGLAGMAHLAAIRLRALAGQARLRRAEREGV